MTTFPDPVLTPSTKKRVGANPTLIESPAGEFSQQNITPACAKIPVNAKVTLADTNVHVLVAANPMRRRVWLKNVSATAIDIAVGFDVDPTTNSYAFNQNEKDYLAYRGEIRVKAASSGAIYMVLEESD